METAMVLDACRAIGDRSLLTPRVAIVLGSGLGALADHVEHSVRIPYSEIPAFLSRTLTAMLAIYVWDISAGCRLL